MATLPAEIAIRELLANNSDITNLVSTRIYPVRTPQKPEFPLIIFGLDNAERQSHMTGASSPVKKVIRIDCYSETYAGVKALSELIADVLHGYSGTVTKDSDSLEISMIENESESDGEPELYEAGSDEYVYSVNQSFNVYY